MRSLYRVFTVTTFVLAGAAALGAQPLRRPASPVAPDARERQLEIRERMLERREAMLERQLGRGQGGGASIRGGGRLGMRGPLGGGGRAGLRGGRGGAGLRAGGRA